MSRDDMGENLAALGALPIEIASAPTLSDAAEAVAAMRAHRLSAYDAAYLVLAQRNGLPLATNDSALRAAAVRAGVALLRPVG